MNVLVVVGVAVVVLGALVLLLFPDRPGGKIAWQGAEVSSIGAGLPLIVVGIAAIVISGGDVFGRGDDQGADRGDGGRNGGSATEEIGGELDCPGFPQARVVRVPQGASAVVVAGPNASKTEPFTLHFRDDNQTVGALTASKLPGNTFEIEGFVDADCNRTEVQSTDGTALDVIPNFASVMIPDLMGRSYEFNLGSSGGSINARLRAVRLR